MSATVTLTVRRSKKKRPAEKKDEVVQNGKTREIKKDTREASSSGQDSTTIDYYDSSDEEDLRNTIGNIPVQWYDDQEHIGYNLDGDKISKPAKKGEIDLFLEKMEDPDYWRKVFDRQTGTDIPLTEEQIMQIHSLSSGKCPKIGYNPYEPFLDIFSSDQTIHPIDNAPPRKSAFVPSRDEMLQVSKMVHAIKMGWLKPRRPKVKETHKVYDLWSKEDDDKQKTKSELARMRMHCPAPKMTLPTNAESYNPPEEYLMTEEEKKAWEEAEPEDRRIEFIPRKYDCLRRLPAYDNFVKDRYNRCLDLYLAPRQRKMKLNVKDHTELLPDLPNPNDLKPFPTTLAQMMRGHSGQVRALSFEPSGTELLASGGEDGSLRIWSVSSGRCIKTHSLGSPITSIAFCPNPERALIAVTLEGKKVLLVNSETGDRLLVSSTTSFLSTLPIGEMESKLEWKRVEKKKHGRISIETPLELRSVVWHAHGDYFATASPADSPSSVFIHQLSKAKSQSPFAKKKGVVRGVAFAATVPHLFLATERHVRVYDLAKCQLLKKLQTNTSSISVIVPDNHGENIFVGGLDRRFSWMDLQLSTKPWKTLRHHSFAIRSIAYHRRLPLLATVSDDGTAIVYYARIHIDSLNEHEIVPVKRLSAHQKVADMSVLSVAWHPTRAWLFTAGADGAIAMFSY